jgi:anti-sigma B factor antagonist
VCFTRIEERSLISTTQSLAIESSGQTAFLWPLFAIDAANEGDAFVIRVKGELDLFECPRLERALREAEASHAIRILLDLEELTFIDAAGLSVLVTAWHRSMTDSNRLRVTHGKGSVADMFRLTALDMVLPFVPPARSEQAQPLGSDS